MKNLIKKIYEYKNLKNNCKNSYIDSSIELRLPQYIKCEDFVNIGKNCKLLCWDTYNNKKLEKKPQILIKSGTKITRNLTIQCANNVTINNNVLIASDVFIIDYNHGLNPETKSYFDNELDVSSGVIIDEGAWIGNNTIILGGVKIGKKSIIGAGAVVTHDIPDYCIAVGNPANIIKKYDFENKKWILVKKEQK